MRQILVIALREITRLRRRFSGAASPLTVVILLLVLGAAAYSLRQMAVLGSGLYRVGVTGDVPTIQDERFAVMTVEAQNGRALLDQGAIDVWINADRVIARDDEKSRYAVGALRRYLEKRELERINTSYEFDRAFPLRVGISYVEPAPLPTPAAVAAGGAAPAPAPSLAEASEAEVIIPSLMTPPAPFVQVIIALLYILPVTFISIFFTSSFMDEKINRRLLILMSTPVTPFQIIVGKMLPYAIFAVFTTAVIAWLTNANVATALLIFIPTILFIFAIYLMVPMFYRTFKDTTFIAMLVTTVTTAYLVFPAMFTGVSDLAYMSPLTLAVQMYRGESFGWREYLFPSLPMAAIFGLAVYAGTRLLNEEFLIGYRSITRKLADAVYLALDHTRPYLSTMLFSLLFIPVVYMLQVIFLIIATNLPPGLILVGTLVVAALIEELTKSVAILVLLEQHIVHSVRQLLALSALSALGFLIGEKLLLLFSISVVSQMALADTLLNARYLLIPLLVHFVFTSGVVLLKSKARFSYTLALLLCAILHAIYNLLLTGVI